MAKFDGVCPKCGQTMKPIVYGYGVGGCRPAPAAYQCETCQLEIARDGSISSMSQPS